MHGLDYKKPGFHSGYNEVVLDGSQWPAPDIIVGFYVVEGGTAKEEAAARDAHRKFLDHYKGDRSLADTPLLLLRQHNWDAPFALLGPEGDAAAAVSGAAASPQEVRNPLVSQAGARQIVSPSVRPVAWVRRPPPPPWCSGRIAYDNSCIPNN